MELTGRIVADATVKNVGDNKNVINFNIAINRRFKSGGEQKEETTYVRCSYWRTTKLAQYLTKGLVVQLQGHIKAHPWVSRDGELMASLDFHINEINLLGASRKPSEGDHYNEGASSTLRRQA